MSQTLIALESFLALSQAMANAAEAQEWDDLVLFDNERLVLLKSFPTDFVAKLAPAEQLRARTIFISCLQLEAQTKSLVADRQKALRVFLREPLPTN